MENKIKETINELKENGFFITMTIHFLNHTGIDMRVYPKENCLQYQDFRIDDLDDLNELRDSYKLKKYEV